MAAFDERVWHSSGSGSDRGSVNTVKFEPVRVVEPGDEQDTAAEDERGVVIAVPGPSYMCEKVDEEGRQQHGRPSRPGGSSR